MGHSQENILKCEDAVSGQKYNGRGSYSNRILEESILHTDMKFLVEKCC